MAIELKKDGFLKGNAISYNDKKVCFSIENREGREHLTTIVIESGALMPNVSLPGSEANIQVRKLSAGVYEAAVPVKGEKTEVNIELHH